MAVTLVGEVVNSADATTGYNVGNINATDDDFVEGTGAIGLKASVGLNEMYTTDFPTASYDFRSGGGEFEDHIIMWFNTKTPINTSTGIQIIVGNGTDRGRWTTQPAGFYKGGFFTAVVDTARDFDVISAGSWTVGGNPAQLESVTQMGGGFTTLTSIMGNFNNIQLDQFTIGQGLRAEGGTGGTPNTFETARAADEDGGLWGWWSSKNGQVVGKGKLYIGPLTGTDTSVFNSLAESVVFADERVAIGFYELEMRGNNTDVTWELASISAATGSARWSLTVSSSNNTFSDTNSVWQGADQILLTSGSHLTGTTIIDSNKFFQSGSTMDGITVLDANTVAGEAFVIANNIALVENSTFEFSDGHAIELPPTITTPITYSFSANVFTDYTADDTSGSALFNNTGGEVLINVVGGAISPTVRDSIDSTTDIQNPVVLTLTNIVSGSEVRILSSGQTPPVELDGTEESGTTFTFNYTFASGFFIDIVILDLVFVYERISDLELGSGDTSIPIQQRFDRNYSNPT